MESVGVQQLQATGVGKVVAQISRSAKSSTAPYMEGAGKAARCVGGVYSFIVGFRFTNNSNISRSAKSSSSPYMEDAGKPPRA